MIQEKQPIILSMTVKKAAKMMGKSEQFIRIGLRNQRFPFGTAVKTSSHWAYHISPQLFYEYLGLIERNIKNNDNIFEEDDNEYNLSLAGYKYFSMYSKP